VRGLAPEEEDRERPGDRTHPHAHPDSVMVTLTAFRRRLHDHGRAVDVDLEAGLVRWLDAQTHAGENIGTTESRAIFVELKEPHPGRSEPPERSLGPSS
jgi:hypothetical protein